MILIVILTDVMITVVVDSSITGCGIVVTILTILVVVIVVVGLDRSDAWSFETPMPRLAVG